MAILSGTLAIPAVQLMEFGAGLPVFVVSGTGADFDMLNYHERVLEKKEISVVAMLVDALPGGERFRLFCCPQTGAP